MGVVLKFNETIMQGSFLIEHNGFEDNRGGFYKTFMSSEFKNNGLECDFVESYYTISKRDVIRGMHFQESPHDHAKLVTIISGKVIDVIVDIRPDSKTYGNYYSTELTDSRGMSIYIPRGFAHGFAVLSEIAVLNYNVTTEHVASHDMGFRYDSFGYDWGISNPIISERDKQLPSYAQYKEL